jgi:hypothetical protein
MVLTISALASSANQLRELVDDVVADDAGGVRTVISMITHPTPPPYDILHSDRVEEQCSSWCHARARC